MKKYKTLQELFRSEKRWTQYALAKDADGYPVPVLSKDAVQFCLLGGIRLVYGSKSSAVIKLLAEKIGGSISSWNDNSKRTIEQIRSLVKRAKV